MNNTQSDPFYVVKFEVETNLDNIRAKYEQIDNLRGTGDDVTLLKTQLESTIRNVEWDLQDLDETISVVLGNRKRFNLSDVELQSRQKFVQDAKKQTSEWRGKLAAVGTGAKAKLIPSKPPVADPAIKSQNDRFIENEIQHQETVLRQQDEGLDELAKTVQRIGTMGMVMHRELNEQAEILEDLEDGVGSARNRLSSLQRRLDTLMEESSRGRLCLILWLFVAFVVLTILVVLI